MKVTRIAEFDAAHLLVGHPGKCGGDLPHGHRWRVEVTYEGLAQRSRDLNKAMVVDFGDIDEAMEEVVDDLDHSYINEIIEGEPTSEALVLYFKQRLPHHIGKATLQKVRVWETPKSYAEEKL